MFRVLAIVISAAFVIGLRISLLSPPPIHHSPRRPPTGIACEPTPTGRDKVCLLETRDIGRKLLLEILPHVDGVIIRNVNDDEYQSEETTKVLMSAAAEVGGGLNPLIVYGGRARGQWRRDNPRSIEEEAWQSGCVFTLKVEPDTRSYSLSWSRQVPEPQSGYDKLVGERRAAKTVPLTVLRNSPLTPDGKPFPFK